MSIVFACAASHAPGITAWAEAAVPEQRARLYDGYKRLREELDASGAEVLILLTSEHWANFFLDHISAFCVGVGAKFAGPIEPWLRVARTTVHGDAAFAQALIEGLYEGGVEASFSHEMVLDHGTMVPLHFLDPESKRAVVPIMFNTLAPPQPSARRALDLGRIVGAVAAGSNRRVGIIATGGLSHDPGERGHGRIVEAFDTHFLEQMAQGDLAGLSSYSRQDFAAAGAGAFELLAWVALAGALGGRAGKVVAYEAVQAWATGMGLVSFAGSLSTPVLTAT